MSTDEEREQIKGAPGAGQYQSVSRDITERKKIEGDHEAVIVIAHEEKVMAEAIIAALGDAISIQDTNYRILYQNQISKEIYGDHVGEYCYRGYRNQDQICEGCHLTQTFKDGKIRRVKQSRNTDKGMQYYDKTVSPLKDSSGKIIAGIELVRDITEHKQVEDLLRLTRFTVDNATDAVYWMDSKAQIIDVNETACKMLGYTREELLNRTVLDIDPDFTPDRWDAAWERVKREGKLVLETVHRTKDGRTIPVEVVANLLTFGGKELDCAFVRDISHRKVAEEELLKTQRLESLGILAGGIAHDFNNLLQAIIGNISLAKILTDPKEKTFPLLEESERASEHAKELSYRLLTFSKGGGPVRGTVSLENVLKESISLCLSGSNVACELSFPEDLDPVEADKGQLNQVFNNLLINAKEAMPDGGTVEVSATNVKVGESDNLPLKEGNYVKVSLTDHGTGIPEKYLPRIFDPYFSTKDRGSEKGMGLGLAICYSIVAKHEGYVAVESRLGVGTVFHIYLPATERRQEERPEREGHPASGKARVLFMDDDERVRKITGAMLEQLGCEVEFAKNGEEAIERYRRAREAGQIFYATILDLTVQGGMGGEKAVRRLLEIDPEVKAVVSSGYADDPVMKDFGRYGFVDALAKPYKTETLKRLLARLQP